MIAPVIYLSLLLLQSPRDPVAPRDARATPQGTATIYGQVTLETGQPLGRALVQLFGGGVGPGRAKDAAPQRAINRTIRADAQGRFRFTSLPAGTYRLLVTAGAYRSHYLPMAYGARRATDVGKPIELADGQ